MKYKKLSAALMAAMLLGQQTAAPLWTAQAILAAEDSPTVTVNGISYVIDEENQCASTARNQSTSLSTLTIPQTVTYNGVQYPVTVIGDSSFANSSSLVKVVLPEGLVSLEANSFTDCPNLREVSFPSTLKEIGSYCFRNTGLKSVALPEGLEKLDWAVFTGCTQLSDVQFPTSSLTEIGRECFSGCTALQTVTLPDSVTTMGQSVFLNCTNLRSAALPAGVTKLVGYTFSKCENLRSVTLPANLTEIGMYDFAYCSSLLTVNLPETLKKIGNAAFIQSRFSSIEIPAGVTSILGSAFNSNPNLTSFSFPDGVKTVSSSVLANCTALTSVHISPKTVEIQNNAFLNTQLQEITLPETLTDLGSTAFGNTPLTALELPSSLSYLGDKALQNIAGVNRYVIDVNMEEIGDNAFDADDIVILKSRSDSIDWGKLSSTVKIYGEEMRPYLWMKKLMPQYVSPPYLQLEEPLNAQCGRTLTLTPVYNKGVQVSSFTEEKPGYTVEPLTEFTVLLDGEPVSGTAQEDGTFVLDVNVQPGSYELTLVNAAGIASQAYPLTVEAGDPVEMADWSVEVWLENPQGGYSLDQQEVFSSEKGTAIEAAVSEKEHYIFNTEKSNPTGIAGTNRTLKLYYDLESVTLTLEVGNGSPAQTQSFKYGQSAQLPALDKQGTLEFAGWKKGDAPLQAGTEIEMKEDVTVQAVWIDYELHDVLEQFVRSLPMDASLWKVPENLLEFQSAWQAFENQSRPASSQKEVDDVTESLHACVLQMRLLPKSQTLDLLKSN